MYDALSDRRRSRLCLCGGRLYALVSSAPQFGDYVVVPGAPARVQRFCGQPCLGVLCPLIGYRLPEWFVGAGRWARLRAPGRGRGIWHKKPMPE